MTGWSEVICSRMTCIDGEHVGWLCEGRYMYRGSVGIVTQPPLYCAIWISTVRALKGAVMNDLIHEKLRWLTSTRAISRLKMTKGVVILEYFNWRAPDPHLFHTHLEIKIIFKCLLYPLLNFDGEESSGSRPTRTMTKDEAAGEIL